jgi:hypothetical protein
MRTDGRKTCRSYLIIKHKEKKESLELLDRHITEYLLHIEFIQFIQWKKRKFSSFNDVILIHFYKLIS